MKNKWIIRVFLLIVFFSNATHSFAQKEKRKNLWKSLNTPSSKDTSQDDYYGNHSIRYEDYVYRKNIKSVQLRDFNFELTRAVIGLGSSDQLKLSFDDLDADFKSYSYTLIHCNADWKPSDLMSNEYIDGFIENSINDFQYSLNTLQHYTHYNFTFPNSSVRISKSGNYILKVYLDDNPDNLVITRRFMVFDNKISIAPLISPASIIEDRFFKQEIDFKIKYEGYQINNPYGDLKVVLTQNNRWDNAKKDLKPTYVQDQELIYDYDEQNVFPGGNEFRIFDIRSIRYQSENIRKIKTDTSGNHVDLITDEKRSFKRYNTQVDLNGDFLIKTQEGRNSEVEADYCYVSFFLSYPSGPITDGNLYVFGAFNGWQYNPENLLHYNPTRMGYECTLFLKQGYYNYEYVFLKDGENVVDETFIEGMHFETENDYAIYVYHRQPSTFYDQLIGYKPLNSVKR